MQPIIKIKVRNGALYNKYLEGINGIKVQPKETNYARNIYWVYGILIDPNIGTAENIMKKLNTLRIGTRPFFYPMHKQPVLKKMGLLKNKSLPISEKLYKQGFYLPSGLKLTPQNIKEVSERLISLI